MTNGEIVTLTEKLKRPLRISLQSVDKIQRQQAASAIVLGKRASIFHIRVLDRVDGEHQSCALKLEPRSKVTGVVVVGAHPAKGEVMQVNKERASHLPLKRGVSGAMAR